MSHTNKPPLPTNFLAKYGNAGKAIAARRMFNAAIRAEWPGGITLIETIEQVQQVGRSLEDRHGIPDGILAKLAGVAEALEQIRQAAAEAIVARYQEEGERQKAKGSDQGL